MRDLVNILNPSAMGFDSVGRKADKLNATLGEFGLELGEGTEFGGADGSII